MRIITDSAADMIDVNRDDLTIIPMKVLIGNEEYLDGVNLSHKEFYEKLIESKENLPKTTQITANEWEEHYNNYLNNDDELLVITIGSKLSNTYQSALLAAKEFEGRVYVVDSNSATVGERILVELALKLKDEGKSIKEIIDILENEKKNIRLIALLDTLEYLKHGGRISKAVAFIGGVLLIKPVVGLIDGKVSLLGKARGSKSKHSLLKQEIDKAGGIDFSLPYAFGYTGLNDDLLNKYINDNINIWDINKEKIKTISVGSTIGTHIGPDAIAVAYFAKNK